MANEVYTRTNQTLFFARKAAAAWRDASTSGALDAITQARYHREHVLFHLYRTVLAVVHEVAERYRWPLLDVRSVEQALDGSVTARFPGPELAELTELASAGDSWLAGVLSAWHQLQAPPRPVESKPLEDDLIIASSAVMPEPEWSLDDADAAIQALAERIACYREGMVEW